MLAFSDWCNNNGGINFLLTNYMFTSFTCSSSPGQLGLTCPRGDKPQHAGADLAHVRRRSAADLHADAERLVPPLHKLICVHGSDEEPGGASPWAIDSLSTDTLSFSKWRMRPARRSLVFLLESCYLEKDRQENEHFLRTVFILLFIYPSLAYQNTQTRTNARSGICWETYLYFYIFPSACTFLPCLMRDSMYLWALHLYLGILWALMHIQFL